jgi:transcriptional regulator with XRE-family HTH domain
MFKERLRELREQQGLTQEQLGKLINLAQQTISHYEKGLIQPDLETLIRIAEILNTTTDYLLGTSDSRHRPGSKNPLHDLLDILNNEEERHTESFVRYLISQRKDEQAASDEGPRK